jgi:hypothetical protein
MNFWTESEFLLIIELDILGPLYSTWNVGYGFLGFL